MKVKSLEWENIGFGYMYNSIPNVYTILNVSYRGDSKTYRECKFLNKLFYTATSLKEAKEQCQKHYEEFILSQTQPESLEEKRILTKSIDLRNNHIIKDLGNGYSQIIPIDSSKRFGDDINTKPLHFTYRNYKGIISDRKVIPSSIYFGSTEYHKEAQWLLSGFDLDKMENRVFAVCDIIGFGKDK